MVADFTADCPELLKKYLYYILTIRGRSKKTADGYYVDLRLFFRFLKIHRKIVPKDTDLIDIKIADIDENFIKTITLSDSYEFLHFTNMALNNSMAARARKSSSLRGFFKYLTQKENLFKESPLRDLDTPSVKRALPKYLTLEQSLELLNAVTGKNKERDYCMITLFLNCGMRLSELVGISLSDISNNKLRILGKGNKERVVYLNEACMDALNGYYAVRNTKKGIVDKNAVFLSKDGKRLGGRRVEIIIAENLMRCGLSNMGFSTHKLRHTAATLMYQHGDVDVIVLKEILGHENLGTTEIYTHVSNKKVEQALFKNPLSKVKPVKKENESEKEK